MPQHPDEPVRPRGNVMVAPPSAVTVPWPLLPQPGHIHNQHTARLAAPMSPETPGKVMEASGSSSQSQDNNGIHRETENLDYSSDEDHHSRGPREHRRKPRRDGSPGADHGELEVLKDDLQLCGGDAGEMVLAGETGLRRRGSGSAGGEVEASQLQRLNIKKDDEFFHFVLLCFAIGSLLVCYHYYADWFMSLGVGLLTFASLETIGIYFGLVYRIHSVLQGFIPLLQKFRLPGFRRTD
ncbi:transmembrane protein 40 isoform X2 [Peromyscus maniculatus bairdii]|uniref:transmembrane protein 40 isoform X2 n=1 Tax=Peromyscus maniculatus bairdii TaxID=230844 RepID=UPI001C2E7533|nr:transmembrane protein 40 isoform X2 [Peromyscus maniculatus bairdii]